MTNSDESFSRRKALQLIAGASLLVASDHSGSPLNAASPDRSISFGFSLYGMKGVAISDAFRILKRIGYDAVELACMPGWPAAPETLTTQDRKSLQKLLAAMDLQLPALMENLPLLVDSAQQQKHLDRIQAAGELGHALSPSTPPVIETILGGRPTDWPAVKNKMVDALGKWAKTAEGCNTVIAVKPHVSGAVHAPEAADWLVRQVDSRWIRLAYDFSHYQVRSFDFGKSLELLLPHTAFIHVKDNLGKDGKVQFALPGAGNIDYETYFQKLLDANYQGTVMVEVSSQLSKKNDYDPVVAAQTSFENLKPIFLKTGLWCGGC